MSQLNSSSALHGGTDALLCPDQAGTLDKTNGPYFAKSRHFNPSDPEDHFRNHSGTYTDGWEVPQTTIANQAHLPGGTSPEDTIPVSTAFHLDTIPTPNTLFISSDGVAFYVHDQSILKHCPDAFEQYLSAPLQHPRFREIPIYLDASSAEVNIILHALYGTSPAINSPDTTTLINSVDRMPTYGISPQTLIHPLAPLYGLLLAHAPLRPLEIYALAAHHNIASLAVSASTHLLAYDLTTMSDDMAQRMGAIYLKKILTLQIDRQKSLKQILLHPPHPHPPTDECGLKDQGKLTRTWALVSAYFVWDAQSGLCLHSFCRVINFTALLLLLTDLSSNRIRQAIESVAEHISCELCRQVLAKKIKDAVVQWATVKVNCFVFMRGGEERRLQLIIIRRVPQRRKSCPHRVYLPLGNQVKATFTHISSLQRTI